MIKIDETPAEDIYELIKNGKTVYVLKNKLTGLISFAPESVARMLGYKSTQDLINANSL